MTLAGRTRALAAAVRLLALLLVALAAWLAFVTWWDQRSEDASSYGVLGYAAAVVLGVLALSSLSLVRAARASGSTALLVLATVPLLLVAAFLLAGAT